MEEHPKITKQLSPEWERVLRTIEKEKLNFGEIRVKVQNGRPVLIEWVKQAKVQTEEEYLESLKVIDLTEK